MYDVTLDVAGQYRGLKTGAVAGWAWRLSCKLPDGSNYIKGDSGQLNREAGDRITDSAAALTALYKGLQAIKTPCNLTVIYEHRAVNNVVPTIQRGFTKQAGGLGANAGLIMQIAPLLMKHNFTMKKVEHSGVQGYAYAACPDDKKKKEG